MLCSKWFVKDEDLLVTLERKENIQIVVKNYESCTKDSYQPDVLIDERTGILLFTLEDISADGFEEIQTKIISILLKCCVCHIIVYHKHPVR